MKGDQEEMAHSPEDAMWLLDSRLKNVGPILSGIRLLSLDIFDTLLFRACPRPEDVFDAVGRRASAAHLMDPSVSSDDFGSMRSHALHKAYENSSVEPHLEDILSSLPPWAGDPRKLLDLELRTEAEYCYVNQSILSLMRECRRRDIRVALLSDMYLRRSHLIYILNQNGISEEWVDCMMVSSDEGTMKRTGGLFQKLLGRFPQLRPSEILHIGDNLSEEIVQASRLGIRTCHYDVIEGDSTDVLNYEIIGHREVLPTLFSLRKLAMSLNGDVACLFKRWHQVGTGIIGPFVSAFCEWIVDTALEENIDVISPFMREAVLLTPILKRVIKKRQLNIPVVPLHVSRQAVVLAGKERFDGNLLDSMSRTRQYFRISELFSTLGFKEIPQWFCPYSEIYLENAKEVLLDSETSVYEGIEAHLLRNSNRLDIESRFQKNRHGLLGYIDHVLKGFDRVLSVDIGFFGQIQEGLESACRINKLEKKWIHALGFGRKRLIPLMDKGLKFRVFAGGVHNDRKLVSEIHRSAPVFEQLFMLEEGSTLGYRQSPQGRWRPVLEENPIDSQEIEKKRAVHEGVARFQDLWLRFLEMKPELGRAAICDRPGWVRVIHRLIRMPTPEEARLLGDLHNDTNYGSTRTVRMCPEDELAEAKDMGPEAYKKAMPYSAAVWPHGILTRIAPTEIFAAEAVEVFDLSFETMLNLAETVRKDGFKEVIAVGKDGAVRDFIRAARAGGIQVICAVDEENALCGGRMEGVDIVPMSYAVRAGHHCFALACTSNVREFRGKIMEHYKQTGHTPAVYGPVTE